MGMLASLDRVLTRAFNPGSVAVDSGAQAFGVPAETWSPAEYGTYIATSNAVYTCVTKRATYLSSLPLMLSKKRSDGEFDEITKGAVYEFTRKVNPYWTWRRLIEMTEMALCLWGSAYWMLERGNGGPPKEMYWARPDKVRVFPHPDDYVARFEYQPTSGATPIPFRPDEVIWFRRPNPLDEYSGLSPLAAARLAADTQSAAMKQNYALFRNGISIGGLVTPAPNTPMSAEDGEAIKKQLQDRAKGAANAHRWLVLLKDAKFTPMTLSPRDAEFVGLHKLTLEDIARAYGVPLDLIQGERTYANLEESKKLFWSDTILPEAGFIADEITEQLLPMFAGTDRVDVASFDHSGVDALQADQQIEWQIAQGQLQAGVLTQNEYRKKQKQDPVPWGEQVWWGSVALTPIKDAEMPEPDAVQDPPQGGNDANGGNTDGHDAAANADDENRSARQHRGLSVHVHVRIAYDSDEHRRIYQRFVTRTEPHEARVKSATRRLFRQQEQSILTELGKQRSAVGTDVYDVKWSMSYGGSDTTPIQGQPIASGAYVYRAADPEDIDTFMGKVLNLAKWRKRFREAMRPELGKVIAAAGQTAIDEVAVGVGFDVQDPRVQQFLFRRAQRFAVEVNDTTWERLKASLAEGLDAGEGTDVLKERVKIVMGDRIRSSAETIARTETVTAYNGGTLEGWRQSGVVEGKQWIAALDDRTRETHVEAHGQVVAIDDDFTVGDGRGPSPGQIGQAEEDINCRCSMLAVLAPVI